MTDWATWEQWCDVTGRDPLTDHSTDTLARFAAQMPAADSTRRRRLRSIIRGLYERGQQPLISHGAAKVFRPVDDEHLGVHEALTQIPAAPWPEGFTTRRDGFVVALAGAAGLTRAEIQSLRYPRLTVNYGFPSVDGKPVPIHPKPQGCPACHIDRWLAVWSAYLSNGRTLAQDCIDFDDTDPCRHFCRAYDDELHTAWRHSPVLVPAIDPRGLADERTPVAAVTVSRIVTKYQQPLAPRDDLDSTLPDAGYVSDPSTWGPAKPPTVVRVDIDADGDLADALDRLDSRLDELLAQAAAVEHQLRGELGRIHGPRSRVPEG